MVSDSKQKTTEKVFPQGAQTQPFESHLCVDAVPLSFAVETSYAYKQTKLPAARFVIEQSALVSQARRPTPPPLLNIPSQPPLAAPSMGLQDFEAL